MKPIKPISEVFQKMMESNPKLMQRMKDANDSLASDPIEILTTPSEDCPFKKCDGAGWLWFKDWSRMNIRDGFNEAGEWVDERLRSEWMEKCECYEGLVKQRKIDKKLDLAGIPKIFLDSTIDSFNPYVYRDEESVNKALIAKKAAESFVKNFEAMKDSGKGLYLYSQIKGSGKTRIASSIANALIHDYGVNLAFIKADDLLLQIRKSFDKESKISEVDVLRTFCEVPVLVIDDIAVEKNSEFAESRFNRIVDYRVENKLPTIFTSNKKIDGLLKIYKEGRISSRIKKMALEIYMPEESVRDLEAEKENEEMERLLFG